MSKRPIYLPIELQDVFELIEEGKVDSIYLEDKEVIKSVKYCTFSLAYLQGRSFYVKQEYTPIENQEVGKDETN
ncbi:TPA: hypothetical protein ACGBG5_003510 [Enterococcus faecalis]